MRSSPWLGWRCWFACAAFWCGYYVLTASIAWQFGVVIQPTVCDLLELGLPIVLTPPLFAWAQRLVDQPRRSSLWILGIAGAVVVAAAVHGLLSFMIGLLRPTQWPTGILFMANFQHVLRYAAVFGFALAVVHRQQAQIQQRELLAAQLGVLRAQLQPHFLFNTLHAIGVVAATDATTAVRMLTLLGDLLRQSLRGSPEPLVTLAEECQLLQPYLELQQMRFADRLRFAVDVPAWVAGALVPDFLLQPLVENALQHGIERRPEGGTVRVTAVRAGDHLELRVHDDGPGPGGAAPGTGLGATTARLRALYGDAASMTLEPAAGGGTVATIRLPFQEAQRAA